MSFYSEIALTASRLIVKYGKSITLKRSSDSIDPVTGTTTSGATQYYKLSGIFKLYPDNLIDGKIITSSDRLIIMDGKFEPLLTDTIVLGVQPWSIEEIKTSEPANDVLIYFVRIRR